MIDGSPEGQLYIYQGSTTSYHGDAQVPIGGGHVGMRRTVDMFIFGLHSENCSQAWEAFLSTSGIS